MSDVKCCMAHDGAGLWTPYVQVVLASDYAIIDAALDAAIEERDLAYGEVDALAAARAMLVEAESLLCDPHAGGVAHELSRRIRNYLLRKVGM